MKRDLYRNLSIGAAFVTALGVLTAGEGLLERTARAETKNAAQAPRFEVDPMWPKPLPHHWRIGSAIGVGADTQDHIWIIHRAGATLDRKEKYAETNPPSADCCTAAPPVLEFDQEGNLIHSWGGPGEGYEWPDSNHGITVDSKGIVWIGGNGASDGQILKFTKDGKFVKQFGFAYAGAGSNDLWAFNRVAKIFLDEPNNEAYISDGYGDKRVAVIDMESGKIKRYWGAYGNKPDDANIGPYDPNAPPAQQFRTPVHCSDLSVDNLLYVCDRPNNRLQVFTREGKFVKEVFLFKKTLGDGAVWDVAFSRDPQQTYLYVADGENAKIHILRRDTLDILTSFGEGGRQPGQWHGVHNIATDSRGNIYTTETYDGKRIQKFAYKGLGPVTARYQGTPWPASAR